MTERKKLNLNRPRKASQEEQLQSNSVYRKKVLVNTAPKKQAKKPHPPKVAKQQPKKPVVKPKQVVKVKIPKPTNPPKKRLPLEAAILQITTFWPNLFSENQLRPMKIGIQQLSQRTKDAFPIRNCFAVSRIVKPSAFLTDITLRRKSIV